MHQELVQGMNGVVCIRDWYEIYTSCSCSWKCGMSFFQMLKSLMVKEQCMCIYIYILKNLVSYCLFLFPLWFLPYGVYPQHIVYFAVDSEGEALKRCNPKTLFDFFDWYMGFLGCETYKELYVINLSDESLLTIQFDGISSYEFQSIGSGRSNWTFHVMMAATWIEKPWLVFHCHVRFWGVWYIYIFIDRYGNCMAQDY